MSDAPARRVYFDHNATTAARPEVVEAMLPYFTERPGNPNSIHLFGFETHEAVEEARGRLAGLFGCAPDEILFTSGGTESDNLALRGSVRGKARPHVVTTAVEHPAVLATCRDLERDGVEVDYAPVDRDGVLELDEFERMLRPDTSVASVMLANNETGVVQPVAEAAALCRERQVPLHVDGVQGVGKIPVDVDALGADMLSVSGHKFYGPKGIGALYVRGGIELDFYMTGGAQEGGLRPGTMNVPGIVGMGEAALIAKKRLDEERTRIAGLRDRLESGLLDRAGELIVNGRGAGRLPNTLSLAVPRIEGEAITLNLSVLGFAVSSVSACASGAEETSYVLRAMGLAPDVAQGAVRISLGAGNTEEEVDLFIEAFVSVVSRLRELSPL